MNIDKQVRKIEAIIDQDFEKLEFWNLTLDAAIIVSCQLFEEWAYQLDELIESASTNLEKITFKHNILDLMEAHEWLIKKIFQKCKVTGLSLESKKPLIKYAEEAFKKAFIHTKAEQIFIPYGQKLYIAKIISEKLDEEELEFNFPSQRFGIFEGINSVLLDEHNNYKLQKYEKVDETIKKLYSGVPEMVYQTRSMAKMEFDFDFPDEYKIGPYSIKDIKNVWRRVIRDAWWGDRENKISKLKKNDTLPELREIKIDSWDLVDVSEETATRLINDLTFNGNKKGEQKFTTPITEPIFELSDGRKVISPKFILYNQPGRNILSTLNRIYGDEANNDSAMKEIIFINDLSNITSEYSNLSVCHSVPVNGTDIDYGIYDEKSHTLVLFEMKWFVEPVTSIEIKNKDKEIKKGLHVQLPKYKETIEQDIKNFTIKAFKKELEVKEIAYFVLTRITIGSGLIEPSPFKTINLRMVKKALFDASGKLDIALEKLKNDFYLPKLNEDFSLEIESKKIGRVKVNADSIKKLDSSFNLSVPSDKKVELFGIEMDPNNVPSNKFTEVSPGQYQLDNNQNEGKISRRERRRQERENLKKLKKMFKN